MAHFAKLDENNVVIFVTVGRQEDDGKEAELTSRTGDVYKQTSYNTRGGVHYQADGTPSADQSKALRKNYAGLGYTYDAQRDAFIPPQPYASWLLNEDTCLWESPVPYPTDIGTPEAPKRYTWDEATTAWVLVEEATA
jgi:hypothetical protein